MLAHDHEFVIGVDTHRDQHALALLETRSGSLLLEAELAAGQTATARRSP